MVQFRYASAFILTALLVSSRFVCPPASAQEAGYVPLNQDQLQQLSAPVALYPDALLAQVLVACTYPGDVVSAAQWIDAGNNPAGIDDQDWDLSVKGVARYPDLLHYMAGNGDWMNQLGDAFINQQADVMNAIQALRGEALASGGLVSNDQQQVVVDGGTIEIIPTNPQILYAPIYDPQVVYVMPQYPVGAVIVPRIRFGPGIRVGPWLHHDLDWHDRSIYVGSWGADRPWWRHDAGRPLDYTHDRPGVYRSAPNITINIHNRATNLPAGRWTPQMHDARKPMPRPVAPQGGRRPDARPGTGYPPRAEPAPANRGAPQEARPATYGQGSTVARQSARGQQSRQQAAQPPPEASPTANRPAAPAPAQPARPAPAAPARHALPAPTVRPAPAPPPAPAARPSPPAARPSAPVRGGAMGGYQNGSQAAANSSRGAASRGVASSAPQPRRGR